MLRAASILTIALGCTAAHGSPADEESLRDNLITIASDGSVSCSGPAFETEAQDLETCVSNYDRGADTGPIVIQIDRHAITGDVMEVVSQFRDQATIQITLAKTSN